MKRILRKTIYTITFILVLSSCASSGVELLKAKKKPSVTKNNIETTLKSIKALDVESNFVFIDIVLQFKNQSNKYVHIQLCEYDNPLNERNLEYNLRNSGLWGDYQNNPDLFDTRLWTKNSDTKIHSLPVIDKPFFYTLYINKKDGKSNQEYNKSTNLKYIKPSEYKQEFTLSAVCGGDVRGLRGNYFEKSTKWIAPNGSYEATLRHALIRGTKPVLLQHPDYFSFELEIEPIQ